MRSIDGPIRWGIIGVGDVCEKKSGPAFSKVPDSKLVAVMRRNKEKARDYAERHHIPRYYSSATELLEDEEVNAVYIATPPAFHEEYAVAAARAGKPVYIEKPVTLNAAGCRRLIDISIKLKVRMAVAHYRRRLPVFLKIRELIESGAIGDVRLVTIRMLQAPSNNLVSETEYNWRVIPEISGGGIFHDLAPHQLDILCWLFGKPEKFSGSSFNQGKHYPSPDLTYLQASFGSDIYLNGVWSFNVSANSMEDRCEIFGESGKLGFSFFRSPSIDITTDEGTRQIELSYPEHVQQAMIADVVQYFRGRMDNPSPLEEAIWTLQMMDSTLT